MFPAVIWCNNLSALACTQMEGIHKLKSFDDDLEEIQKKLEERKKRGQKSQMSPTHWDFVKLWVLQNKVRGNWVASKENEADIMMKP